MTKHIHVATVEASVSRLTLAEYDEWQSLKHRRANLCEKHRQVMTVYVNFYNRRKRYQTKCALCFKEYDQKHTALRREEANKRKKYYKTADTVPTLTGLRYADEQRLRQYRLDREAQDKRRADMQKRVTSHPYLRRISK